ncbi:MAG: hypothetical protein D6731_02115, partial [Planctomycetota bacterium]
AGAGAQGAAGLAGRLLRSRRALLGCAVLLGCGGLLFLLAVLSVPLTKGAKVAYRPSAEEAAPAPAQELGEAKGRYERDSFADRGAGAGFAGRARGAEPLPPAAPPPEPEPAASPVPVGKGAWAEDLPSANNEADRKPGGRLAGKKSRRQVWKRRRAPQRSLARLRSELARRDAQRPLPGEGRGAPKDANASGEPPVADGFLADEDDVFAKEEEVGAVEGKAVGADEAPTKSARPPGAGGGAGGQRPPEALGLHQLGRELERAARAGDRARLEALNEELRARAARGEADAGGATELRALELLSEALSGEAAAEERTILLARLREAVRSGDRGVADATRRDLEEQLAALRAAGDPAAEALERSLAAAAGQDKTKTLRAVPGLGSLGQVGLRSLVLQLPAVGALAALGRSGGGARVELTLVREATFVTWCGLLALAAFLALLLVPRGGRVSAVGLLCVFLGAASAGAAFVDGVAGAALLNAAAAGALFAAGTWGLLALARAWELSPWTRLRSALAARGRRGRAGAAAAAVLLGVLCPWGSGGQAHAQEAPEVFVPYDSKRTPDPAHAGASGKVYVPLELYEELLRRARPAGAERKVPPPVPYVVAEAAYRGDLGAEGLRLTVDVRVGVLAPGWQRVPLGLQGAGLLSSRVEGGEADARVRVAPAGGFELVARGPADYRVTLEVVVARSGGGYPFAAVPTLAARLELTARPEGRAVVVEGARSQSEARDQDGTVRVDASLGDARTVRVVLRSREVLSAGASEASAATDSVVWVRRTHVALLSETTFAISGAGREGFLFLVPEGFEVTGVESEGMRSWRQQGRRLEVDLRRPTGRTATVRVQGELRLAPGQRRFAAPQVLAQGVSREAGTIGVCVARGLRVRPVNPTLRQREPGSLAALARRLGAGAVERAYGFARRPSLLELERVREAVELKADVLVRATILSDLYLVDAELSYDVSRGKVYELVVQAPRELELVGDPRGLDVREVTPGEEAAGVRTYRLGLASALRGRGRLQLTFARRLAFGERAELPFPDVRPVGVRRETARIAIAAGQGLAVRVPTEPRGLSVRDARSAARWGAPRSGSSWRLAYARSSGRVGGLVVARLVVRRPRPRVTGSWVLHARVERDVVRYALRVFYEIENAGVSEFHALLPARVAEQVELEAQNLRELRSEPAGDGLRRFTVALQSPAEVFYDYAFTWEEPLGEDLEFSLPRVGIDGVDRAVKGYLLVQKAPEVVDVLEEVSHTGDVEAGARAAEAPALPPGTSPRDFLLVYALPLDDPAAEWGVRCRLVKAAVALPGPARIPFAHVESVFTPGGDLRHRVRYRVRNLRLQFLSLRLPQGAKVWSVYVDGRPRRLFHAGARSLVPLPKRSAADLSFDVELVYSTPAQASAAAGGDLSLVAPVVESTDVEVEETFWTVYVPDGFEAGGFEGNLDASASQAALAKVLEADVKELARLDELAQRAHGNKKALAEGNLLALERRIERQVELCEQALGTGRGGAAANAALSQARSQFARSGRVYRELMGRIRTRQQADTEKLRERLEGQRALLAQDVLEVDGRSFERTESGWRTNRAYFKKGSRVQWSGVGRSEAPQQEAQQRENKPSAFTLVVPEGADLDLSNAQVDRESEEAQRRRGKQYGFYQQQQAEQKAQEKALGDELDRLRANANQPATGAPPTEPSHDPNGWGTDGAGSEGLLSLRVPWKPKGRAWHFAGRPAEAPSLRFRVRPAAAGGGLEAAAQALCLLLLFAGVLRLGILRSMPGRVARQTLLLLGVVALGGLVFVHPVAAALAFLAGLWALRHGPLEFGSAEEAR